MKIAQILLLTLLLELPLHAEAADEQPPMPEPDHLVPVNPYPGGWNIRYMDEIRTQFKLPREFYLQMLVLPSFNPEYVIRMHGIAEIPSSGTLGM